MKTLYKSKKVPDGVELSLRELLEEIDGWDFENDDGKSIYTLDAEGEDILQAKVGGKAVKIDSIKVILRCPKDDNPEE